MHAAALFSAHLNDVGNDDMAKTDNAGRNPKQEPGSKFNQPSGELVRENTLHEQEVADSRDHDKQAGRGGNPKKATATAKTKPGKS
jgi:hypothetical protein